MDEELKAYLDVIRSEVRGDISAMQRDVIATRRGMNDGHERLLNRLASLEQDFRNTKGFLVGDATVSGRRWLDLDGRVSRLERDQKSS